MGSLPLGNAICRTRRRPSSASNGSHRCWETTVGEILIASHRPSEAKLSSGCAQRPFQSRSPRRLFRSLGPSPSRAWATRMIQMAVLAFFIYWRRTGSARRGAPERKGCWRSERSDPCKWPQKRKGDRLRQTETSRRRELVRLRYPVPRRLRQLPLRRVRFAVGQSRESVAALSCRLLLFASSFSCRPPERGSTQGRIRLHYAPHRWAVSRQNHIISPYIVINCPTRFGASAHAVTLDRKLL